jgi:soluble lytic murein transglycosylase-like protein
MDLSTNDARLALARKWAAKHGGLDPYIVCAVCEQESSWNPFAVRYENEFLARYVKPLNPLSPTTQEITRACSFGLMQVMGLTAMEFGWRGYFLTDLCDPDNGVDYGCRKLQQCFENGSDDEHALLLYNGGGNAFYGQQVLARASHYMSAAEGAD